MGARDLAFVPTPDVAIILQALLDVYERRNPRAGRALRETPPLNPAGVRSIRCHLETLTLPAYHSQTDPQPRQTANEQLQALERAGVVKLVWLPGEAGHLLASVALIPSHIEILFALLERTPQADRRARLTDLLLGERFRFQGWRLRALQHSLDQLKAGKSPLPFSLTDEVFNRDVLTALSALDEVREETPYRVFSVRVFNDSKRFDDLLRAVAVLARHHQPGWRALTNGEVLRELNLVANPDHLYLHGPWQLVDEAGQVMSLGEFYPAVGLPAMQAACLKRVTVSTPAVICVENPTSFYELIRYTQHGIRDTSSAGKPAAICLWGNPSPACRHLLRCLPNEVTLYLWADIDYGGLNILTQLREQVNANAKPYRMDIETLEAHHRWARPLASADVNNLNRLLRRPSLTDMRPLIVHMLQRQLKLEQEAVRLDSSTPA